MLLTSGEKEDERLLGGEEESEGNLRRRRTHSASSTMTSSSHHHGSWTTWTWTIMSTCLLLLLSSVSVRSVPLVSSRSQSIDLTSADTRGGGNGLLESDSSSFPSASLPSSSSQNNNGETQLHQQLVRQHQLYLPSLVHLANQEDNGHILSPSQQSEDDSIGNGNGGSEWETVIDPHLYVLNEWMSPAGGDGGGVGRGDAGIQQERRRRNAGPSLSIVNPLDVLRQRLLLEIARRRMIKSQNQIMANAEILRKVGRRRR